MTIFNEAFWVGCSFVAFVALVYKPAVRFITSSLDMRAKNIQNDLDNASQLKEQAQSMLSSYQRKKREAEEEAKNIISFAEEEAQRNLKEAEKALEETINKRIQMAMDKIAGYEAGVLEEARKKAMLTIQQTVRALLINHTTPTLKEDLVDHAIQHMKESWQ